MESFYRNISNEDVQVRVEAVRSLVQFATDIGAQRTVVELLPQLRGLLEDDDEVLLVLAEELGGLIDLLGESKISGLIFLLTSLSQVEEEAVRQKATNSLLSMCNRIPSESFSATYISLVIQLGETPWFTSKMSCCVLLPSAMARANDEQKQRMTALYLSLCRDSTPMTRRAAANHLRPFIPYLSYEAIMSDFVETFQTISKDDQDSVRLLAVDVGAGLAQSFTRFAKPDKISSLIIPVVLALAEDKSWRVRYQVASSFVTLGGALSQELNQQLLHVFIKLLKDSEQEVRTAAAGKVSGVANLVPLQDVITHLLPCVNALVKDESQLVRAALAKDVMVLAPAFGQEGTLNHLLNIFLQLLKDDVPEVRLNVISKLDQVTPFVGLDKLSEHLIPAIIELGENKSWRVRFSVIGDIPPLASQLNLDFFISSLSELCFAWLADTVYAVRQAAIQNLKKLTVVYGEPFSRVVVPRIAQLCTNTNYLHRMTCLLVIHHVASSCGAEVVERSLLPLVLMAAVDDVANVRIAGSKALGDLAPHLDRALVAAKIKPVLQKLAKDADPDVSYFAGQSLLVC